MGRMPGARKKTSRKSEEVKGAQCPTLSRVQILQLVSTSYSRYVAGDATGHSTNARRVGPADLSTGTRPWHLGTTRPLPGIVQCKSLRSMAPFYDPLVLRNEHALSQCSCAESEVPCGGRGRGPGWNMIPQNVQGTERRTRERAMTGRKERAIMINLTNARYVPSIGVVR